MHLPDLKSLRNGRNVLTAQVHQTGASSSDVYIEVSLLAGHTLTSDVAQMDGNALQETINQARVFLPETHADDWLRGLWFAYRPTAPETDYEQAEPDSLMARARIQSLLGRQDDAVKILEHTLERFADSTSAEDAATRYAIEAEMQRVMIRSGGTHDWTTWWRDRVAKEVCHKWRIPDQLRRRSLHRREWQRMDK